MLSAACSQHAVTQTDGVIFKQTAHIHRNTRTHIKASVCTHLYLNEHKTTILKATKCTLSFTMSLCLQGHVRNMSCLKNAPVMMQSFLGALQYKGIVSVANSKLCEVISEEFHCFPE